MRLSVALAYAAPAMAQSMLAITFYVYLQRYYGTVLSVDLASLGWVVLASRAWDAITDPLIGAMSDRTRTRWGRRKPWIAAATLPSALAFLLLFHPPRFAADSMAILAWLWALAFLFFLAGTMVTIPYEALGAELSFDYDERTRILGIRDGALLVGTLLGAIAPVALGVERAEDPDLQRRRYFELALLESVLLVVSVAWCLWIVREKKWAPQKLASAPPLTDLRGTLSNRPFLILLAAYTINAIGSELPATLILFYTADVLGTDRGGWYLVLYLAVGLALLPLWIALAHRWEKKWAWIVGMAVNAGMFAFVLLLGRGDEGWFALLACLSAVGLGATLAIPSSMQADVIDVAEAQTGRRLEGQYSGLWAIARKLARGLGASSAFLILAAAGYRADAPPGSTQSTAAVWTLAILYAGVPSLFSLAAIGVILYYPIDRATHRGVRGSMENPHAAGPSRADDADPSGGNG